MGIRGIFSMLKTLSPFVFRKKVKMLLVPMRG